jgi:4-hydroxy-tetrahydrodipicolinate reductase
MNIALLGYGKMGKTIEELALKRNHNIVLTIDNENEWRSKAESLKDIDVAIDFSTPSVVIDNITKCFENSIPIVVGTTAWQHKIEEIKDLCIKGNKSLIWASNFSVGVNIFFKINSELAKLMNKYEDYNPSMEEIHHTAKLDAPSGTAISLADEIINNIDRKSSWALDNSDKKEDLIISSKRIDPVPGTHTISYDSEIDTIEIKHIAKNRKGFALGALLAAEWIMGKQGFYEFKEVFF